MINLTSPPAFLVRGEGTKIELTNTLSRLKKWASSFDCFGYLRAFGTFTRLVRIRSWGFTDFWV